MGADLAVEAFKLFVSGSSSPQYATYPDEEMQEDNYRYIPPEIADNKMKQ